MKRYFVLFLLVILEAMVVSAQETRQKQLFDSQNRLILNEKGNRINYREDEGLQNDLMKNLPVQTRGSGDNITAIAICEPQWFQGTMGSCIGFNSMITEDLDHDGKTEIICGGGSGFGGGLFWYVMKYDETSHDYRQVWFSSPVDYNTGQARFTCIRVFDVDGDNIFEIFVGYDDGKVEIFKGDDMALIRSFSSTGPVNDVLFADGDNDGVDEVILCSDDHSYFFNNGTFILEKSIPYGSYRFAAGNVDADPGTELVYSDGTVLEMVGGIATVEWNIYNPSISYSQVSLTDTDDDGKDEVIIAKAWYVIDVYDADLKALKGTINADIDIDAMIVADVNGDARKEILYGDGQWGDIYCFNSLNLQQMWSIPNPEHGVTQLAVADVDNDAQLEVLWGAGCSSTGTDLLYIHNIANQALEFESKDIGGPFYDVETGDVDGDGQNEIVTISFESGQGYDSGILSVFDGAAGNLEWQCNGSFFTETWEGLYGLELTDVTGDATKEIIVAGSYLYDGAIYIVNGITHQKISSKTFGTEGIETLMGLDVADVDNDGTKELVTADNNNLFVINPAGFSIEWTSPSISGYGVKSVKTGNVDGDPNMEMIICKGYITVYDGVTHSQWTSNESNCTNIDLYDWDNDGVLEIITCTSDSRILMLDRQTNLTTLLLQAGSMNMEGVRVIDLDGTGMPEFVFTSGGRIYFANAAGDLISTAGFGPRAGSIDALKLSDVDNDGIVEIYAGTQYQVVQVSEECSQCLGFKAIVSCTNASCLPGNDGKASAAILAGTPPYAFQWSNGSTLQSISGLAPGNYSVQVTDSKGCPAQDTAVIAQSVIGVNISGKNVGCYGVPDGSATIGILTGTPPYQYNWTNGATLQSITGLSPGIYGCVVTDQMACSANKSISIKKDSVSINLFTENPPCFGDGGEAMVQILSGDPPFNYLWGDIPGGSMQYDLPEGNYTVTVRDALNCMATQSFTITEPPQIMLSASFVPDNPGTPEPDGQATVYASGGSPPYYFRWDDPYHQTNSTAINLAKGHYKVVVSDVEGCDEFIDVFLYGLIVQEDIQNGSSMEIFPNPAMSDVNVTASFPHRVSGTLELVNASGMVVIRRQFSNTTSVKEVFKTEALPASLYMVILRTGETTLTGRVIIGR